MPDPGYVKGKNKEEILDGILGTAQVGSPVFELQKAGITVRCTEDIEKAIGSLGGTLDSLKKTVEANADSANKLASKVFWLNVILTIATVIYAGATIYQVFFSKKN